VFRLKKGEASFDVQIKQSGYKPELRTIRSDQNKEVLVVMGRLQTEAQPAGAAAAPKPAPQRPRARRRTPAEEDMKTLAPVF
jgi:hypothetical protein